MDLGKSLTKTEKQKTTKLLSDEKSSLEISKEIHRYHRTIMRAGENITKLRTKRKIKVFKNLSPGGEQNLKRVTAKQRLFMTISPMIVFEVKRCTIFHKFGSLKKTPRQTPLSKTHVNCLF